MQKTDKILEFTIPLRLYYNTLSDEEFEIVSDAFDELLDSEEFDELFDEE